MAITVFSIVAAITLLPGETDLLATLYSFGAMLSFTIAHVSVVRLRQRFPDKEREWTPPGSLRMFGFDVPLTAVFGGLGTFTAWIVVMVLNPRTLVIGAIWMFAGIAIYLLYRRSQGISVAQTHKVLLPEPLGVEEIEYQSVLVAFEDDEPFSEQTVATAVKLASKRRRGIHVISVLTVPPTCLSTPSWRTRRARPSRRSSRRSWSAGLRVSGHVHRVRPGQAGHSIAGEAKELEASALVMGLRYRNGAPLYGKTLQTVMAERPCRVIVVGEPDRARSVAGLEPTVLPGTGAADEPRSFAGRGLPPRRPDLLGDDHRLRRGDAGGHPGPGRRAARRGGPVRAPLHRARLRAAVPLDPRMTEGRRC